MKSVDSSHWFSNSREHSLSNGSKIEIHTNPNAVTCLDCNLYMSRIVAFKMFRAVMLFTMIKQSKCSGSFAISFTQRNILKDTLDSLPLSGVKIIQSHSQRLKYTPWLQWVYVLVSIVALERIVAFIIHPLCFLHYCMIKVMTELE